MAANLVGFVRRSTRSCCGTARAQAGLRPGMHIKKVNGAAISGPIDYQEKFACVRALCHSAPLFGLSALTDQSTASVLCGQSIAA